MKTINNREWVLQKTTGNHWRIMGLDGGRYFTTSNIVELIDANTCRTSSGSMYRLEGVPYVGNRTLADLVGLV